MISLEILVLAPSPTHPQDFGNRKRIYEVCRSLKDRGARIHYLHYPAESDWRDGLPTHAYQQMVQCWDSFNLVPPTRPLHQDSAGADHAIDEWWDPAIGAYLTWLFSVKRFDAFIVNYTWLSKALEFAPKGVFRILDTHDRFSGRRALLEGQGLAKEFFHTTPEQETIALDRADLVWAIKDEEREFFSTLTRRPVLTLLHSDPTRPIARRRAGEDEGYLAVGVLGARNNINVSNLRNFVAEALPVFRKYLAPIKLRIAGSMCEDLAELRTLEGVELMGRLENVDDFYAAVDAVLIPMSFSTGLKIKTAEALAAHGAIIAHRHAFEGFPPAHPYHQLESFAAIAQACVDLSFDGSGIDELRQASVQSQLGLQALVDRALDASMKLVRRSAPRLVMVLPAEALEEGSLAAIHASEAVTYLRYVAGLVFYCDFDVTPERAQRLDTRFAPIGAVMVAPGRALAPGRGYGQASLQTMAASHSLLALWLLTAPTELRAATGELTRVPVYLRADLVAQGAGGLHGAELTSALQAFRWVRPVATDVDILAPLAGALPRSEPIALPLCRAKTPKPLERWTRQPVAPVPGAPWRVLLLARDPGASLTQATIAVIRAAAPDADLTVLHVEPKGFVGAADRPGAGHPVAWLKSTDVHRDLSRLGARPHLAIAVGNGEVAFELTLEICRRLDIPVVTPPRGREGAAWFAFVQAIVRPFASARARPPPAAELPSFLRYGNDAGWAHLWRTLGERHALTRLSALRAG